MELRLVLEDCCKLVVEPKAAYFVSHMHELSPTRADLIEKLRRQHLHQCLLQHPHHSYPHQKPHHHRHHMLYGPCHADLLHNIIPL
uniref:Uncharacterized protein n=1 Tax=Arundo donax TaxID=35708 RepID=A0A0A9CNJ9_ARUDO